MAEEDEDAASSVLAILRKGFALKDANGHPLFPKLIHSEPVTLEGLHLWAEARYQGESPASIETTVLYTTLGARIGVLMTMTTKGASGPGFLEKHPRLTKSIRLNDVCGKHISNIRDATVDLLSNNPILVSWIAGNLPPNAAAPKTALKAGDIDIRENCLSPLGKGPVSLGAVPKSGRP